MESSGKKSYGNWNVAAKERKRENLGSHPSNTAKGEQALELQIPRLGATSVAQTSLRITTMKEL